MKRLAALVAALVAAIGFVLGTAGSAWAVDGTIAFVNADDGRVEILLDVPAEADVELDGVKLRVDDEDTEANAELAAGGETVRRTTVMAIDTSDSMQGERFAAAKAAALAFLDAVPDDVYVGIVGFDAEVVTALEPSLDRAEARTVVDGLALSKGTFLYDGIGAAIDAAGDEGQREVLVLSDGADTSESSIDGVVGQIEDALVQVDVVALDQEGDALGALEQLATAGGGEVISSDSAALETAFADEAATLSRQILITADLPDGVSDTVDLSVSLPSSAGDVVASATTVIGQAAPPDSAGVDVPAAPDAGLTAPGWLLWVGIAVFGVGLVVVLVMLVPSRPVPLSAADRISTYSTPGQPMPPEQQEDALASAKEAAAGVLERNQGLETRIKARLDGAGSELKPQEWLLLHFAIVIGAGVVGLLIGGGSLLVGILFMVGGVILPWVYLGFRRSRRRKAFNQALPETLQLISGSLAAGLSLSQSMDTIVREGGEPMSSEFKRVLVENRLGVPVEDSLENVAARFDSQDFAWVVMAIKIQRQVGGNLAELLDTVAATMREREFLRRQVNALAAEGKLSALVLSVLPPGFLLYLLAANRDYVMPMFTDIRGILMLVVAAVWLGIGVFWMSKLVKVEV